MFPVASSQRQPSLVTASTLALTQVEDEAAVVPDSLKPDTFHIV